MAIDFPNSPTVGQTYSVGSRTWTYNGTAWILTSTASTADGGILDGGTPSSTAYTYRYDGGSP